MKGEVIINGKDAFTEWGINFEDGALSALMTPPPMKDYIESRSRLQHGINILPGTARFDEREINLVFHLLADNKTQFMERYNKFCNEVLVNGVIEIETKYIPDKVFRFLYLSCTQFTQFRCELAIFSLKVKEPNPTDREQQWKKQ